MNSLLKFMIVASGTAVGTGSNFLIQVFLANKLSVHDFGFFTSIFNVVNLLSPLVAFGITNYLLKCYSEEGINAKKWFNSIIWFNLISVLVVYLIFYFVFIGEISSLVILMFFTFMVSISFNNFTLLKFQVGGRFGKYALWSALPNLFRFVLVFLLLSFFNISVFNVGVAFFISSIFVLLYSFYSIYLMKNGQISLQYTANKHVDDNVNILNLLKFSYPYGLSSFFYLIYYQIDIFILKYYVSYEEIAYYGVALIFVSAICLLPTIYYQQVSMPKIHYWSVNNKENLEIFYKRNLFYSVAVGILFYIVLNSMLGILLKVVFGNKYTEILSFFYILSLVIPLKFVTQSAGAVMNISQWIKVKVFVMGFAAFFNLLLNVFLIKNIGLNGAIYSTILTELFIMFYFLIYLKFNFRRLRE